MASVQHGSQMADINEARERVLAHSGVILPDSELLQMICDGTLPGEPASPSAPLPEPEAPTPNSKGQIMQEMRRLIETFWQNGYDDGYAAGYEAGYEARREETRWDD